MSTIVFYDPARNALYISGIAQPFPAGSLEARKLGSQLAVANPMDGTLLCAWADFSTWTVEGVSTFASVDAAFAALQAACTVKRPLGLTYVQPVPATIWTIPHGLGFQPGGLMLTDSAGDPITGDARHPDANTLTITFANPVSGTAYLS